MNYFPQYSRYEAEALDLDNHSILEKSRNSWAILKQN